VKLFIAAGLIALGAIAHPAAHAMPVCQYEDGSDVDGQCLWTDPDTGNVYINPTPEEVGANDQ
jgi:hypothetical protein